MDVKHLHSLVVNYNIDWLVHFSALLSAIGEKDVIRALEVQSYSTVQCGHDWDYHNPDNRGYPLSRYIISIQLVLVLGPL